jgi:uncharacterized linocin/CFP29 family protein
MPDYLARDLAPLSDEEWGQLDELVVNVARKLLVGRRMLPVYGPLGAGALGVPLSEFTTAEGTTRPQRTSILELHENPADFALDWREIERARQAHAPIDFGAAAGATVRVADMEDSMIFGGCDHCGTAGLLTAEGAGKFIGGDWMNGEALYADVIRATSEIMGAGQPGPFAVVLSPRTRSLTHRMIAHGMMLNQMIEDIATAGVYTSRHVPDNMLLAMAVGPQIADLAIGLDATVAYIGNEGMSHLFRVLETITLRLKMPVGICVVTAGKAAKAR